MSEISDKILNLIEEKNISYGELSKSVVFLNLHYKGMLQEKPTKYQLNDLKSLLNHWAQQYSI